MTLTYVVAEFSEEDSTVDVTYTNESGHTHRRSVRIPRTPEGTLDEDLWDTILAEQLEGLKRKIEVGAANFVDPNAPDDIPNADIVEDDSSAPGDG